MSRTKLRFSKAPLALASDGTVLMNVARLVTEGDLSHILDQSRKFEGPIFIGVPMSRDEVKNALRDLDDAAAEVAARVGGARITGMR